MEANGIAGTLRLGEVVEHGDGDVGGYSRLRAGAEGEEFRVNEKRHHARDLFNLHELQLEEIFQQYDSDGSGHLDIHELLPLLKDIIGGDTPSQEEVDWIMKVADHTRDNRISKIELVVALQAWHGYVNLPAELQNLFAEFDKDSSNYLDIWELRALLTKINERDVSMMEAKEVMEVADIVADGQLGKYELLGAVGAWYVSVGRRPTPAMGLAFLANNRTGGRMHKLLQACIVGMCVPCSYFPIYAGLFAGVACDADIRRLLLADGLLWLALSVVVVMKGHWVQLINRCYGIARAHELVYAMSWATIALEISVVMVLSVVETLGLLLEGDEDERCERTAQLPVDVPLSLKNWRYQTYPGFLDFCKMWFTFNLMFNFVTLLAYYAHALHRFYKVYRMDRALQSGPHITEPCAERPADGRPMEGGTCAARGGVEQTVPLGVPAVP